MGATPTKAFLGIHADGLDAKKRYLVTEAALQLWHVSTAIPSHRHFTSPASKRLFFVPPPLKPARTQNAWAVVLRGARTATEHGSE